MKFTLFNMFKRKADFEGTPPVSEVNPDPTAAVKTDPGNSFSLDANEVQAAVLERLEALMADKNYVNNLSIDHTVPQGVSSEPLFNPKSIEMFLVHGNGAAAVKLLISQFAKEHPQLLKAELDQFLDESNPAITDALVSIYPGYKEEILQNGPAAPTEEKTQSPEASRIFSTQVQAVAEGLLVEAKKFMADEKNQAAFSNLNDYETAAILSMFEMTVNKDRKTVIPAAIKTFMETTPVHSKDANELAAQACPILFTSSYESKLWDSSLKMIDMSKKDPATAMNEIKSRFGTLKEEMTKKVGVEEKNIYYIKEGMNVLFMPAGKKTFLGLWASNSAAAPNAVLSQFVGAVQNVSPEAAKAHDNQMDTTNFQGMLDDMSILSKAQESGHRAAFGTNAEPLLDFLIAVAAGGHDDVKSFDVTRPGAHGRDTDIQMAIDHMTLRGLFPTIKPDLKSEKWTLTINPGPTYTASKAFSSALTTDLQDVLMVFAARSDNPMAQALNKVIKAYDKYALAHLEDLDIQGIMNGYTAKITDEVMKALDKRSGDGAGQQQEEKPQTNAPKTPLNTAPEEPVVSSLHAILKRSAESQGQSLVGEIMRRYHGVPTGENVEAYITERNIPPFPITVYEIEIEGAYLKNLPQVQATDMNKILTGEALGQYEEVKPGLHLVHSSFDYVNGKPAYIIAFAAGEAEKTDPAQVNDPVVRQILTNKGDVEDALDNEDTLRQLAQTISTQGNLPDIEHSQIRNQIEQLEQQLAGGADKATTEAKIRELNKKIKHPENKESLGIDPAQIQSMAAEDLRGVVEKYLDNFSRTRSYAIDYSGMKKVHRTPEQDKVARDITNTIYDLKNRAGLLHGDTQLPEELTQKVLDTLINIQKDLENAGVPTMGAQEANRTMATLTKAALAGDIKSIAYVEEQLKTYLSQLDQFLKQRGGGREAPFVKKLLDTHVLPLAQTFSDKLGGPKDPNRTMLTIGQLENYLEDLNSAVYSDQGVAPIANALAQIKEENNIKGHVNPDEMNLDQVSQSIFDSLQEGAGTEDTTDVNKVKTDPTQPEAPAPEQDKSEIIASKIRSSNPNKKNFTIQTLGKNYDRLRPLFEARAKEVQVEIADNDPLLQEMSQLLEDGETNGSTVNIQEGEIPSPATKTVDRPQAPLTPEQRAELQKVYEQQTEREKSKEHGVEEGIKGKQTQLKQLHEQIAQLDAAITSIVQKVFNGITRRYPNAQERAQAMTAYRARMSQVTEIKQDIMDRATMAMAGKEGLSTKDEATELTAAVEDLSQLKDELEQEYPQWQH